MRLPVLTQEYVKERFLYEPETGKLFWKKAKKNTVGKEAGGKPRQGRLLVGLFDKLYFVHRIVWLMHYGNMPHEIDHIDGNPLNNRLENLRIANHSQNMQNASMRSDNKSGVKGVFWNSQKRKWHVVIYAAKRRMDLGRYDDLELAELVADEARRKYHGKFANHGYGAINV